MMKVREWNGFRYYEAMYTPRQRQVLIAMDRLIIVLWRVLKWELLIGAIVWLLRLASL